MSASTCNLQELTCESLRILTRALDGAVAEQVPADADERNEYLVGEPMVFSQPAEKQE